MKCPGQDMQYWNGDAIYEVKCPECDSMVEFYKDDTTRKCPKCHHRFVNPKMDFGCATYCQFAEQCLGTLPEDFVMQQDGLLKDKVAVEVKRYFKTDFKRISFAIKIARYAEILGKASEGANLALILCSSYLFNIGYSEAAKAGSKVPREDLQKYGPPIAKELLSKLGANDELVTQVCEIVGGTNSDSSQISAYAIIEDAYYLTLLEKELAEEVDGDVKIEEILNLITSETAKNEAKNLLSSHK